MPAAIVPEQLKLGVRDACRYEPVRQRTYEEWVAHYATLILPARPANARDKAKVEVAVQIARCGILARLRHLTLGAISMLPRIVESDGTNLDELETRRWAAERVRSALRARRRSRSRSRALCRIPLCRIPLEPLSSMPDNRASADERLECSIQSAIDD